MSMKKKMILARRIAMGLIIAANSYMAGAFAAPADNALPQGESVKYTDLGDVKFSRSGNQLDIHQTADKAIINWSSFDIGKNATVNFNHMTEAGAMNPAGITLNRVTGENMSQIYGNINAIGSIILINPNGAIFADGSQVNAAGIIVSTEDMGGETQENFKNGTYVWDQSNETNANITIMGSINASTNGKYLTEGDYANHLNNNVLTIKGLQPATGFSYGNNKIMLIADGDVAVGPTGELYATTTTYLDDGNAEESSRQGAIILRADQNADDVALYDETVMDIVGPSTYYLAGAFDKTSAGVKAEEGITPFKTAKTYLYNSRAEKIQGLNVSVYYDSDVTDKGINGTDVSDIGVYNNNTASPTKFTQKKYNQIGTEVANYKAKVMQTGLTTYSNDAGQAENTQSTGDIQSQNYYSLINDVYQLQAIQDISGLAGKNGETLPGGKSQYYGNLSGAYALGKNIQAADTANWVKGASSTDMVGFNPIGYGFANPFGGTFTGNGGSNFYGIYDLNIHRTNEDDVGLFASTLGADISSLSLIDPLIEGKSYVGGIAGYSYDSLFDGVTVRKRYKAADGEETRTKELANVNCIDNYAGGIIGYADHTATRNCTNGAYIKGGNDVGGLIGAAAYNRRDDGLDTSIAVYNGNNLGWYSHNENIEKGYMYGVVSGGDYVGGLIGQLYHATVNESHSNGQVSGNDDIGGLVGYMFDANLINSYNTNEAYPSANDVIDVGKYFDDGNIMGSGSSKYGLVTGTEYVGGAAGYIGWTSTMNNVYNAGNVNGETSVGGLVGAIHGSVITNSYNGDHNTMYKSAANDGEQYGFIADSAGTPVKYVYNLDSGDWTSYIYQDSQWSESGTGYTTSQLSELVPEPERLYINRPAHMDAVVTGRQEVGGLVGSVYSTGNSLENSYNAGRINYTGNDAASDGIGGLVGAALTSTIDPVVELSMPEASEANGNFMVTTQNVTGKNVTGVYTDANGVETSIPAVGYPPNSYPTSNYEKTLYEAFKYKVEPPPYVKPDVKPTPDVKPDVKPTPDVKPDVKPDGKPVNPIIPDNDHRYDMDFPQNDAGYEAAKTARGPMAIRNKVQMVFNNAYVPQYMLSARHLTMENPVVRLYDTHLDNTIVIDKSSRADGGDTVTIERKVILKNTLNNDNG